MLAVVQHRVWPQKGGVRRRFPFIASIVLGLVIGPSAEPLTLGLTTRPISVEVAPVTPDPGDPQLRQIGELTYLRGWRLTSDDPQFGGLSALRVWRGQWLAVLDTGGLAVFSTYRRAGAIIRVDPRCNPKRIKLGHDLEGLDTDGTRIWVSSEWHNTICRIDPDGTQTGIRPTAMADWPRRTGAETLLRLKDGRFLVMPEDADFPALLFPRDPVSGIAPLKLRYTPPSGYSPTDAAQLPDGRIVVLNRKLGWRGFSAKLVLLDGIPARGTAQGRTIATLAAPLIHDNFEGIAARREGGATVLTIVSDDNKSRWQETLLLEFRFDG